MSLMSSRSTLQSAPECCEIALGDEIEIVEQRRHRRIEAVAVLELQRQAFGEIARRRRRRGSKPCSTPSTRSTCATSVPSVSATPVDIAGEIAGLVDHADQMLADQPVGGVEDRERQLLGQMLDEGRSRW